MQRYNYELEYLIDDVKEEHNYLSETKKEVLKNVKGNYPQLCTYESEWIYFDETGYIPGEPVKIEYQTVEGTNGIVENAIPYNYKSAILKGNTLVNLQEKGKWVINNNNNAYYSPRHNASVLKTNTKYIIYFTNLPSTAIECYFDSGINKQEDILDNRYSIFTTGTDISRNYYIHIYTITGGSFTTEELANCHVMIIEYQDGMENWDIPYFEGMQSVKMPVLKTTGKNLFNPNWQLNTWYPFKLKSGTKLTLSTKDSVPSKGGNIRLKATDETDIWMSINEGATRKTITLQKDVYKLSNMLNGNIEYQLEIGDNTPYEPYKSNILSCHEDVELSGIGNVRDELDLLTGEVAQRIGEVVFDGSEDWVLSANENSTMFYISFNNLACKEDYLNSISCDKLVVHTNEWYLNNSTSPNGISAYSDWGGLYPNENWIYIKYADSEGYVEKLKQWLSQNPITVQYELATESVKTVDLTPISCPFEGYNNFTTSSDTIPPSMTLEVPVVSTGKQTLQEINE